MKRRRRTLLLLALVPLSIGAGAIGYWRHTSESSAVADDGPVEQYIVARRSFIVDDAPSIVLSRSQLDHAGTATPGSLNRAELELPQSMAEQTEFEPSFSDLDSELLAANSSSGFSAGSSTAGYGSAGQTRGAGRGTGGGAGADGGSAPGNSKHSSNDQTIKGGYVDSTPPAQEHPSNDGRSDNPYADPHPQPPVDPTLPGVDGRCSSRWCGDPHDPYGPVDEHWTKDPSTSPEAKPHVGVPEPSSLGLLGIGLLGILATRRRATRR